MITMLFCNRHNLKKFAAPMKSGDTVSFPLLMDSLPEIRPMDPLSERNNLMHNAPVLIKEQMGLGPGG